MAQPSTGVPRNAKTTAVMSPAGARLYAPGKWGILRVDLSNPHDEPVDLIASTYFVDQPTLQYARKIWVPLRSQIRTWHPALIPTKLSDGGKRVHYRTFVHDARDSSVVLSRSDSGRLAIDGNLRVAAGSCVTGVIEAPSAATVADDTSPVQLLVAAQIAEGRHPQNTYLVDQVLPLGEQGLDSLDYLLIADSWIMHDAAGLEVIRHWLFGGGHLWVMLDRVDVRVLERILGDDFACTVIDRVALTTLNIESADRHDPFHQPVESYEKPIDLVRVAVDDVDVAFRIGSWPAAFWKQCGTGRMLVTTLGARGWMQPKTATVPAPPLAHPSAPAQAGQQVPVAPESPLPEPSDEEHPLPGSEFVPLESMKLLASKFFSARSVVVLPDNVLGSEIDEDIGYSIPPRWLICMLLSLSFLLVAGSGAVLWRRQKLEWLGWGGPAIAVVLSQTIIAVGWQHRHTVPPTVASAQFVEPIAGTNDVRVRGMAGLYSPEAHSTAIAGQHGGWLVPDMVGMEGITRRMLWTDFDTWRWENVSRLAGLRHANFMATVATAVRIEAKATFDDAGIKGRLQMGEDHIPTDAILITRDGTIGVEMQDGAEFAARADHVLAPGQYFSSAALSDEQQRRLRMLRLLGTPTSGGDAGQAQLLFWTGVWDVGLRFDAGRDLRGTALVAVPLQWERPKTGTRVWIPGPLLPYRGTPGPDGSRAGGLWDHRQRRWLAKSGPAATWLRFDIPQALLPINLDWGRLKLKVTGQVSELEIGCYSRGVVVPLKTWLDPVGSLSLEIEGGECPQVSVDGGLFLRVSGSESDIPDRVGPEAMDHSTKGRWLIETLSLELGGVTGGVPNSDDERGKEK